MSLKSLVYNSVTISLPKNAVQFMLGLVLFWLVYGSFSVTKALFAFLGFILTYSSVYLFNDIADYEEDRNDKEKRSWKLVAGGKISRNGAGFVGMALLFSGLAVSGAINGWFFLMMICLVLMNFLHSSPYTGLKKKMPAAAINLTAIEFFKYSCGWFALTSDLSAFPFWLILTFSLVYSVVYIVYKMRFRGKNIISNKYVIVPMGLASVFSYIVSLILYDFALPMFILLATSILVATFSVGKRLRLMNWLWVEFTILPIILIAFLLLTIPSIAEANNNITYTLDCYKESICRDLPPELVDRLKNLSEPRYGSLEELQNAINKSLSPGALKIFETGKG